MGKGHVAAFLVGSAATAAQAAVGDLYVAGSSGGIYRITQAGVVSVFSTATTYPMGMAEDGQGRLYAYDGNTGNVLRFDDQGSASVYAHSTLPLYSMGFDPQGNLYGLKRFGTAQVLKITPDGTASVFATLANEARYLAVSPTGSVYYDAANDGTQSVYRLDSTGKATNTGAFAYPSAAGPMAFDSAGTLFYASGNNVYEYDPKFNQSYSYYSDGSTTGALSGLTTDASGAIYSVNFASGSVDRFGMSTTQKHYASINDFPTAIVIQTVVPEPGLIGAVGVAAVALSGRRRRSFAGGGRTTV